MDKKGPLPPGYEAKWDHGQKAYFFINHNDQTTTWIDPRTTMAAQARPRTPQQVTTQRDQNLEKLVQMFPGCPEEILQSVIRSCENNLQVAIQQLKTLGFTESRSRHSVSPSHSAVKGRPSQTKQPKSPTRNYFTTGAGHSASAANNDRTINTSARLASHSGHPEISSTKRITDNQRVSDTSSTHRITDTSSNQRVTDTSSNQRVTDTSSYQGVTDTTSTHRITDTSSNQMVTDTSSNQRITDTRSNQRISKTANAERRADNIRSPSKRGINTNIKDKTAVQSKSVAVGRNRALQSGPDPTLRLSEHVAASGHDQSLMEGPNSSNRVGSSGYVGADPSLSSRCNRRVLVTNI